MEYKFRDALKFEEDIASIHHEFQALDNKMQRQLLPLFRHITNRIRELTAFGCDCEGDDIDKTTIEIYLLVQSLSPFKKEYLNTAPKDIKDLFETFIDLDIKPEIIKKYLPEFKRGK